MRYGGIFSECLSGRNPVDYRKRILPVRRYSDKYRRNGNWLGDILFDRNEENRILKNEMQRYVINIEGLYDENMFSFLQDMLY